MDQKMIRSVACKLYRKYVAGTEHEARITHEDLIHAGVIGWLEAERRLDSEQPGDGGSYFYLNVQGRMKDLIRKQPLVRMPQIPYTKVKAVMNLSTDMEKAGEVVTPAILARKLNWSVEEINSLLASVPHVISADRAQADDDENSKGLYDTLLTDKQQHQPQLDGVMRKEIAELIQHCLANLGDGRTRLILAARYLEDITLQDLADRFGCTAQTVHYQEKKGLKKMRSCLEKNGWEWDGSAID